MEKCTFCIQRIHRGEDLAKSRGPRRSTMAKSAGLRPGLPRERDHLRPIDEPETQVSQAALDPRGYKLLERTQHLAPDHLPQGGLGYGGFIEISSRGSRAHPALTRSTIRAST